MNRMFYEAELFNQDLCEWKDIDADKTKMFFGTACLHADTPTGDEFCVTCV